MQNHVRSAANSFQGEFNRRCNFGFTRRWHDQSGWIERDQFESMLFGPGDLPRVHR